MDAGHAETPISQEESYVFLRSPLILEEILFCLELSGSLPETWRQGGASVPLLQLTQSTSIVIS